MCGFVGVFRGDTGEAVLARMLGRIAHRGPDDSGYFRDGPVGFGHARLSIIDLAAGHQPMRTADGALTIVFNGEIYNFQELRDALIKKGRTFQTRSDTEVILELYREHGRDCVRHLNGMFAFAIWDRAKQKLFLARDRTGEKPLYYCRVGESIIFASEIKAILEYPGVSREIDSAALNTFLHARFVPGPDTVFKQIKKLPQSHWLEIADGTFETGRYWQVSYEPNESITLDDAVDRFHELMRSSVQLRLISDVPVGLFLSSGVDSSVVTRLATESLATESQGNKLSRSYTIGFKGDSVTGNSATSAAQDETARVRAFSREHGIENESLTVEPSDFSLLPRCVWHLDQPFGDFIVLPLYLLARRAARDVKVVMTGDGADEILGGYVHHHSLYKIHSMLGGLPAAARNLLSLAVRMTPVSALDHFLEYSDSMGDAGRLKLAGIVRDAAPLSSAYLRATSIFYEQMGGLLTSGNGCYSEFYGTSTRERLDAATPGVFDRIIDQDMSFWLPDNILFKQDKILMAAGLEGRATFLDHRLIEFCATLPMRLKHNRQNKYVMRMMYEHKLHNAAYNTPKMPFYIPLNAAYERAFRALCDEFLFDGSLDRRGLFRPQSVRNIFETRGRSPMIRNKQLSLLIMLEMWFRIFIDNQAHEELESKISARLIQS